MRSTILRGIAAIFVCFCGACAASAQLPVASFPAPAPKYEIRVEKSVRVPMRDSVLLSTDLYFPVIGNPVDRFAVTKTVDRFAVTKIKDRFPVILIRTPYDKNAEWNAANARRFAAQGYVVAVQDVRGKFESGGSFTVSAADTEDGTATVEWLTEQPWSSGKVGTTGCSYSGENQVEMAKNRSVHHLAMIPQAASGALQYFGSRRGGAFELASSADWFFSNGAKERPRPAPGAPLPAESAPPKVDWPKLWRSLPLKGMMSRAEIPATDWDDFVVHPEGDPWWRTLGYVTSEDKFDVPALFVDSWYDYGAGDTFRLLNLLQKNSESQLARDNQFVVIAPTTHCRYEQAAEHTVVGTRDLGDASFDFFGLYLAWFDHWLKGLDNGVEKMPKVQLYVMGKNEWRGENEWPLARTQFTQVYLSSAGHANSRFGDGVLSLDRPAEELPDHYAYDPRSPVPSTGGPDWGAVLGDLKSGAVDQSDVEMRQDVLVYTTPLLEKGAEVTGPIEVVLYVNSDAPDTDFTAKLVDVYPDGTAYNVQEGIQRARYREGYDKPVFMKPSETYELHINLNATSNYFGPGHRIRLEVSSSNFPRFDRNLNTGGANFDEAVWHVARNTIYHSGSHVSYILLPVIP
jgi:putative CocE/NonD family hydrolase